MSRVWNSFGLAVLLAALLVGTGMAETAVVTGNVDAVVDITTDPSGVTSMAINPSNSPTTDADSMVVKATTTWKVDVSDADTTNTAGVMTKYNTSTAAYATGTKLGTGLALTWTSGGTQGGGSGTVLPINGNGNTLVTGTSTDDAGVTVGFRYTQASNYNDIRLTGANEVYRIVVTFTAATTA